MRYQEFLSFIFFFNLSLLNAEPLLVAVLMVKNEAPVMEATLQPLVNAGIQDFLIYDTGSTDNTIQVTQNFFIKNNITNFVIEQGEFVDFATSRNKALDLTEQHFPDATFMLMLDAEWILQNGSDLLKYCQEQKNSPVTLWFIKVKTSQIDFNHARLMRCKSNITFFGKVHEVPSTLPQAQVPSHIYFTLNPTRTSKEKSRQRWMHDRDILLKEVQKNPDNPRTVNFLAQTYLDLHDFENAAKWYEYRTQMSGFDEEDFLAHFFLAEVYGMLGDMESMVCTYLHAFCLRPHRAEPLVRLAEYYYLIESYELCYLFARHACTIPYPEQDCSFVKKQLYNFDRYNLLSSVAILFQDYQLGKAATLKALQAAPDLDYLHENLQYYQTELDKITSKN